MAADKQIELGLDFKPKFGDGPLYEHHTTSLVFNDPPYHTRVRRLLTPFFTPRTLRAVEPGLDSMIDQVLDRAEANGELDRVDWDRYFFWAGAYVPQGMTRKELRRLHRKAFLRFYLLT